jgi:hypothetical protein
MSKQETKLPTMQNSGVPRIDSRFDSSRVQAETDRLRGERFAQQDRSSKERRDKWTKRITVGLGALALGIVSWGVGHNHNPTVNLPKEKVTVSIGPNGNEYDASQEIAVVEGVNPNDSGQVNAIESNVVQPAVISQLDKEAKGKKIVIDPSLVHTFDTFTVDVPVAKEFQHINQADNPISGHDTTITFPENQK